MFITKKSMLPAVALGCTVLLAAGCTDHEQLKKEIVQAAQKQEDIRSYHFTGTATLKLDPALFHGLPPMTVAMLSLLKESRIDSGNEIRTFWKMELSDRKYVLIESDQQ